MGQPNTVGMSQENLDRMQFIRERVERTILPFRENTEAAIVIGALVQVARVLLDLYPDATRGQLLEGIEAFLERRDVEGELRRADSLIIPKGIM